MTVRSQSVNTGGSSSNWGLIFPLFNLTGKDQEEGCSSPSQVDLPDFE